MTSIKAATLSLALVCTVFAASTLATPSLAAGNYDKGDWTINHRAFPTELSQDRAAAHPRNESVERHFDSARNRAAADTSGSVPGSTWATKNREAATRLAIAGNHG